MLSTTVDEEYERERVRRVRRASMRLSPRRRRCSLAADMDGDELREDSEERAFRLRVAATFGRGRDGGRRRSLCLADEEGRGGRWVDGGWEVSARRSVERVRRDSFWEDEGEEERWRRWRRVLGREEDEWKPLRGWKRL